MTKTCFNCGRDDDPDVVANLRDQLAAAEAASDRYLTRAVVAEAKVAKVRELATKMRDDRPATYDPVAGAWCRHVNTCGDEILTAIGGDT